MAALGDRLGRRATYATGLVLFALSSAACALAPTVGWLVAARAVQGLAAAMVTPLSLTILTAGTPPARRGAMIGTFGGIGGLAVAAGPLVGGGLAQGLDWHWIFWVNVPIGILAAILAVPLLPESRGPPSRVDVVGALLVAGGAFGVLYGLVRGNDAGWGSVEVVASLAVGVLLLALFLAWEARARDPMLPLRLFRERTFAAATAATFFGPAALFSAAFLGAQFLQIALGKSPWMTGVLFLPWTATPLVVAPLAGRLADRTGPRPFVVAGLLLQAVGIAWLGLAAATGEPYSRMWPALLLAGVGVSMALPTMPTAAMNAVAPQDIGKASGVTNTLQRFGGAFGIAVAGAVFAASGSLASPARFVDGYRPAALAAAAFSLAGAIAGLAIAARRTSGRPEGERAPTEAIGL
jgi:EmrB/QacA subfamily drug resistance transporter